MSSQQIILATVLIVAAYYGIKRDLGKNKAKIDDAIKEGNRQREKRIKDKAEDDANIIKANEEKIKKVDNLKIQL